MTQPIIKQNVHSSLDPNGPAGMTGSVGTPGPIGIPGPPGRRGPAGMTGQSGQGSPSGCTGSAGPMGPVYTNCSKGTNYNQAKVPNATPNTTGGAASIPPGQFITVLYGSNGWMYGYGIPAETKAVKPKDDRDGCDCTKCKEFYPFAEPNQEDGTLICFSCRNGY